MSQHYEIILDEQALDNFIEFLPDLEENEVFYICLFGRHKYCADFPNTKDSGQLARLIARKDEIKEKIRRLECPVGAFSRDGVIAPQACLAMYIGLNPRNLIKANQTTLVELAKRFAANELSFNPISVATTEIHRAMGRKFFVDFDYDTEPHDGYFNHFEEILCSTKNESFKTHTTPHQILKTRNGFHLLVSLQAVADLKTDWYKQLKGLPNCDVTGSAGLTPIPGCVQGGDFSPYFI